MSSAKSGGQQMRPTADHLARTEYAPAMVWFDRQSEARRSPGPVVHGHGTGARTRGWLVRRGAVTKLATMERGEGHLGPAVSDGWAVTSPKSGEQTQEVQCCKQEAKLVT